MDSVSAERRGFKIIFFLSPCSDHGKTVLLFSLKDESWLAALIMQCIHSEYRTFVFKHERHYYLSARLQSLFRKGPSPSVFEVNLNLCPYYTPLANFKRGRRL